MAIYRGPGGPGDATTDAANEATIASNKATEAALSASNAATSASAAAVSASNAATSETNAATSETNAAASEAAASSSASSASTSATAAANSATASATSATAAEAAQTAAETAQTAAETAQGLAETAQAAAATSASSASTSATNAASSATSASTSASSASASATAASASETNAADSESAAAGSATSAASSASSAASSASSASISADDAATSASAASTSATAAASSATAAASSATSAASSATSASNAQTAAEAARDSALAAYDNFDDRYLGVKSSDPTLDNDGNALVSGALYFNSTDNVMKVYTGSTWVAAYVSGAGTLLAANNLSDLNNAAIARTNLGLGTAATTAATDYATSAQGALADSAIQSADLATVATTGAYSDLTGTPTNVSTFTNDAGYLTSFTESDPVFTASVAAGITSTDTTNWDTAYGWGNHASAGYLTTESDPVFLASEAAGITATDTTNWDTAYGWGNHASAGYLTTESDPVFSASEAASITSTDTTNWDTAYGWGDHAAAGYLTSYTETDPIVGAVTGIVKSDGAGNISAAVAGTDYATAAQGALADSAVQPGDNVSDLTNDAGYTTNTGTVTSVSASVPTGLTVAGSPVTTSGTLAISYDTGYSIPTTAKQSNWDDSYTFVAAFPSQTGNSGKYLTTDGSVLSWGAVSGGSSFDSGTVMLFAQSSAPTGWTKDTTNYNGSALRVVTGTAGTGGTVDFTTAFASKSVSGTVGNTTLSTTQIPSHNHAAFRSNTGTSHGYPQWDNSTFLFAPTNYNTTGNTGGGGSHNHSFTGTAINLAVKYVDVIRATKD